MRFHVDSRLGNANVVDVVKKLRAGLNMAESLDLDAYLARINYVGPRAPSFDTVTGILHAHIASIPFESFDVLLGRPLRLEPESLQVKIVANRRGGYCF